MDVVCIASFNADLVSRVARPVARGETAKMPMTAVTTPMAGTTSGYTRPISPKATLPRMRAATSVTA